MPSGRFGKPVLGGAGGTVITNDTVWPKTDGFGEDVKVVVVLALLTN